jgi:hypothetical protein
MRDNLEPPPRLTAAIVSRPERDALVEADWKSTLREALLRARDVVDSDVGEDDVALADGTGEVDEAVPGVLPSTNFNLPVSAKHRLSDITPREVKRYTQSKLAERNAIEQAREAALARGERFTERPLSNSSVNHTLSHLAQILESAVDDELITANPATGSRRRLKAAKPARPLLFCDVVARPC